MRPPQIQAKEHNVEFVSQIGGATTAVGVQGNYAYIGFGPRLEVLDISDPSNPAMLSRTGVLHGIPGDIVVFAEYAYVAAAGGGLYIIDISNPVSPTEVGFYDTPGSAFAVAVAEGHAYVADDESGLRIIDISNPAALTEVGFYDTPGSASAVAVAGTHAYVADGLGGLIVLRLLRDKVIGVIPPSGGSLSSSSGDASFVFPRDTFTDTVMLTYRRLWSDQNTGALAGIGQTFELTAVYSDTGQPAELVSGATYTATFNYTTTGPAIEDTLSLYWWDEGESHWSQEGITSSVNIAHNAVEAEVGHLSLFAVLGETQRVHLPVVLRTH